MKTKAISLLAYGDEHINECNILIDKLSKYDFDFFVGSNCSDKITDRALRINVSGDFNFNLKRISIEKSLEENDIVIAMDTDLYVMNKNIDFSILENINDGIYITWINDEVEFIDKKITVYDLNNPYIKKLNELNNTGKQLFFIDECFLIIKLTDPKKKTLFITTWKDIFNETLDVQPNNGNAGAIEGLIIYLSALKSRIDIYDMRDDKDLSTLFNSFYHCNYVKNKYNIFNTNKRLI